jgi:hypothetical protein
MKVFFTSTLSMFVTSLWWYICINNLPDILKTRGIIISCILSTVILLAINAYEIVSNWFDK